MKLLITGGTGYIGSHTVVELLSLGHDVVIVDNLVNSSELVLSRIEKITGKVPQFVKADICDRNALNDVFSTYKPEAVVHFAGLKAVGESNEIPLSYYHNNVTGSVVLFEVMAAHNVKKLVFSSSATVYGENNVSPLDEAMPTSATNPYGRTKLMIEEILFDLAKSDADWSIINLRYFNPIGAHQSGLIGEDPNDIPNNLLPYVSQVAIGRLAQLQVFGDDYDTPDGTGVRDYIHVVDLALGHIKALEALSTHSGCQAINLGTGNGTSVLEIVNGFSHISGKEVPYKVASRRAGDIATVYANAALAKEVLDWKAERNLTEMLEDTWRWQSTNPEGYTN
ncbi:UDP-glucose 4-epimerase GalE [Thalassotalea sp. PP2-459]|uniref:UDP-glucose 4-epimerase GalE n=1 Tax=Thalassotalea sp. PP2-459 TaxID=1742724 RepID=UPI00094522A3|nr:UDP-glucose 4-epimerase GalE [Thalassotalea sp. PP2-459]OKY24629.1 UDP-glucose 4-epimerase GalE [Thalassotalea sp. PP2-459]